MDRCELYLGQAVAGVEVVQVGVEVAHVRRLVLVVLVLPRPRHPLRHAPRPVVLRPGVLAEAGRGGQHEVLHVRGVHAVLVRDVVFVVVLLCKAGS